MMMQGGGGGALGPVPQTPVLGTGYEEVEVPVYTPVESSTGVVYVSCAPTPHTHICRGPM